MLSTPDPLASLPERIAGLADLAMNLAWSWRRDARSVFKSIDPQLWRLTRHNPLDVLRRVEPARLQACADDVEFLRRYDGARDGLARYLAATDTWFARTYPDAARARSLVAYFCAEFAVHISLPVYSGGLGVLAGDHCKAASDLGVPLVGVGLLYRKGYFDQRIGSDGWQDDADESLDPALAPLTPVPGEQGDRAIATLRLADRTVRVGAWRMQVGRVAVYLLDTDLEGNEAEDRVLSHRLYGGGSELRLRQELLLGLGGVRVLRAAGLAPAAWHANEGHAAFMLIERVRELIDQGLAPPEAIRDVRAHSVFTTHTPVAAGHDAFPPDLVEVVAGPLWDGLGVDRETFLRIGRHPDTDHGHFHMTAAAIRLSARIAGVAERHGFVTREMWRTLWPGREPAQVPIGHVTNGVHLGTWMAPPILDLLEGHLGPDWTERIEEAGFWDRVLELDDGRVWDARVLAKTQLLDYVRDEAQARARRRQADAMQVVAGGTLLTAGPLLIGFARRFATYKRADLIFRDVDRLARLVTNPQRPVQIVFAGKAHPADDPGKRMLQAVYRFARDPRFEGRIAFLEDYDLHLAHRLVQGVDVWLNLPRPPLEACGTSGMKAALNAVPQLSTLDGWWAEGYRGTNGWALPPVAPGADVDAEDADHLYHLLEQEVVPLFYARDERGVPRGWVDRMRHALHVGGGGFTARRMLQDYARDYYVPAAAGTPSTRDAPAD